jgi:hypothetical protein
VYDKTPPPYFSKLGCESIGIVLHNCLLWYGSEEFGGGWSLVRFIKVTVFQTISYTIDPDLLTYLQYALGE